MNDVLFNTCVGGFVAGVAIHSFFKVPFLVSGLIFLGAFLALLYLFYFRRLPLATLAFLFIVCCSLGMVRYEIYSENKGDPKLAAYEGKAIEATGVVVEEPEVRDEGIRITVELSTLFSEPIKKTKILTTIDSYSKIGYGDKITLTGRLELPEAFETDTGREFDYVSYLAKDKIFYLVRLPKLNVVSHHVGNIVKEKLLNLKSAFLSKLSENIVSPESDLMAGLLVSGKQSLPQATQDKFKRVGIIHIVALSGYNVSIVAETLGRVLMFLPSTLGLVVGGLGIVGFTVMAGAGSTILRASIMALLVISSKLLRRTYNVSRALLLAGVLMLVWNPMILIFDPSFQLSFLSTIGIMYVSPIVEGWVTFVPEMLKFRETVIATVATQLFVLPYLLYSSGQLSIVALPVNLLVLFFIPFTMLMGFLTAMLGFIHYILALPFSFVSYLFLHYDLSLVSFFSSLSYASVSVPHFSSAMLVGSYVAYTYILIRFHRKNTDKKMNMKIKEKTSSVRDEVFPAIPPT